MLDQFFGHAIYYATLGHERAMAGYPATRETVNA